MLPKISFVIPSRNEEKFVGRCLESIIAQQYPADRMEILVINGVSEDRTAEIVKEYGLRYPFVKLLQNPQKVTPISVNVGLKNATGDLILILGSHSELGENYLKTCVEYLEKYNVDVVGGCLLTKPSANTRSAKAIVAVLSDRLGTGGATFRVPGGEVREVDAVFGGLYKKSLFDKLGLYNEKLIRSQDMDFSIRVKKSGGKILLVPSVTITYYPKSTFLGFLKHNIKDGIWAILPLKFGGARLKLRHLAPLFFFVALAGSALLSFVFYPFLYLFLTMAGFYLAAVGLVSAKIALKEDILMFPHLVANFISRHLGYGLGSLMGVFKLIF